MKRENDKGAPVKSKNTLLITVLGIAAFLIVALFVAMNVNLGADTITDNVSSSDNPDTLITGDDATPSPNELCETTSLIDSLFGIQSAQAQEEENGGGCESVSDPMPTGLGGNEDSDKTENDQSPLTDEEMDKRYPDTKDGYNECIQRGYTHEQCEAATGGYRNKDGSFDRDKFIEEQKDFAKPVESDRDLDGEPDSTDPYPDDFTIDSVDLERLEDEDGKPVQLDLREEGTGDADNDGVRDSVDTHPLDSTRSNETAEIDPTQVAGNDPTWTPQSQNPPSFRNPKFKDENGIIDSKKYMQALKDWTEAQNGSISKVGTVVPDASVGTGTVSGGSSSGTSEGGNSQGPRGFLDSFQDILNRIIGKAPTQPTTENNAPDPDKIINELEKKK